MDNSPKRALTEVLLTILAIASVSCLISLMALFMGGGQAGTDLSGLMYLQAGITPIAFGTIIFGMYRFLSTEGWARGAVEMWRAIPQWLVFVFLLLNSLVLMGELAFIIVMQATKAIVRWHEHIPLACMFICSSAYLVLFARVNSYPGSPPAMSGRWGSGDIAKTDHNL